MYILIKLGAAHQGGGAVWGKGESKELQEKEELKELQEKELKELQEEEELKEELKELHKFGGFKKQQKDQ